MILVIYAVGAYTVHSSMFDVWLTMGFGVIGYSFKKLQYPMTSLVLTLVPSDLAENAFRQSQLTSSRDLSMFFSNPLVATITTVALVMRVWPVLQALRTATKK